MSKSRMRISRTTARRHRLSAAAALAWTLNAAGGEAVEQPLDDEPAPPPVAGEAPKAAVIGAGKAPAGRSVEIITGGSSTDGAARVGRLPVLE